MQFASALCLCFPLRYKYRLNQSVSFNNDLRKDWSLRYFSRTCTAGRWTGTNANECSEGNGEKIALLGKFRFIRKDNRDHWGNPDVDGRIILRGIFRKWDGVLVTGCSGLKIRTGGGHL
jgi:hypothetical protein